MDATGSSEGRALTKRRYTGATRGDATAGFRIDWPGLSRQYVLVAEAWDDDMHTLTVMLEPITAAPPAEPAGGAREDAAGDPARRSS